MNPDPHNPMLHESSSAEETLRLIAGLPAPAGLAERVHAALGAETNRDPEKQASVDQGARRGRVLAWPAAPRRQNSWMRTAAAAAIVFFVVGGGWGVYSRVQHGRPARIIAMPHIPVSGGFSGAGAMRTPVMVPGPVVTHPATPQQAQAGAIKKPVSHATSARAAGTKPNATAAPAVQAGPPK